MKTVDLRKGSELVKWANAFVYNGEYSKADWEQDQPEFTKFNKLISDLTGDKRLACVYVMHGKEDVIQEHAESAFKSDLVLSFGE